MRSSTILFAVTLLLTCAALTQGLKTKLAVAQENIQGRRSENQKTLDGMPSMHTSGASLDSTNKPDAEKSDCDGTSCHVISISEKKAEQADDPSPKNQSSLTPTASARDTSAFVNIGKWSFPLERTTDIGDIDGNGFGDYIVSFPLENFSSGSIRIYLMGSDSSVISSRQLVPGRWGFNSTPLKPGDRFGTTVLRISDVNGDGVDDLAVSAPGDVGADGTKGAVYILLLKRDGCILNSVKISAETDISLKRQLTAGSVFGTGFERVDDINGDGVNELAVESADGSYVVLFLGKSGHPIVGVKLAKESVRSSIVHETKGKQTAKKAAWDTFAWGDGNQNISIRPTSGCFFNETACACAEVPPKTYSNQCLDYVRTVNGRDECARRDCKSSFKCDCDGTALCSRVELTTTNYVADEIIGSRTAYCHAETVTRNVVKVIPGAAIPVMEPPVMETSAPKIPTAQPPVMPSPVMPSPVMPTPVIQPPWMPTPWMPAPMMPTPWMPTPMMPTPMMPTPVMQTSAPMIPTAQPPVMETSAPKISTAQPPVMETSAPKISTDQPTSDEYPVTVSSTTEITTSEVRRVPVPTLELTPKEASMEAWGGETCNCGLKAEYMGDTGTCVTYHHEITSKAVICEEGPCLLEPKEMMCVEKGPSFCARKTVVTPIYVNDGPTDFEKQIFCHSEEQATETVTCLDKCP